MFKLYKKAEILSLKLIILYKLKIINYNGFVCLSVQNRSQIGSKMNSTKHLIISHYFVQDKKLQILSIFIIVKKRTLLNLL